MSLSHVLRAFKWLGKAQIILLTQKLCWLTEGKLVLKFKNTGAEVANNQGKWQSWSPAKCQITKWLKPSNCQCSIHRFSNVKLQKDYISRIPHTGCCLLHGSSYSRLSIWESLRARIILFISERSKRICKRVTYPEISDVLSVCVVILQSHSKSFFICRHKESFWPCPETVELHRKYIFIYTLKKQASNTNREWYYKNTNPSHKCLLTHWHRKPYAHSTAICTLNKTQNFLHSKEKHSNIL